LLNGTFDEARDALTNKVIEVTKAVKSHYKLSPSGQLMLPESLRLLPALIAALQRSMAFRHSNTIPFDHRSYYIALMRTLSVNDTLDLIAPFFFSVHALEEGAGLPDPETGIIRLPARQPLTSERIERHGLYSLDNGLVTILWVGSQIHPDLAQFIFGSPYATLESGKYTLPQLENPWSQRLHNILAKRRSRQPYPPIIYLVKEDAQDPVLKMMFLSMLVEDRAVEGSQMSYTQWINMIREKSS
jgi:protein transport protein SEC24